VTLGFAGGFGIVKPPTVMSAGAPAPRQLGVLTVPVPGQVWQELQSSLPGAAVNAE
jgi:hypothetical protein